MRNCLALIGLFFSLQSVSAEEIPAFTCLESHQQWKELEVDNNGVLFNNFVLRPLGFESAESFLGAELTFSVMNRTDKTVTAGGQFIFRNKLDEPVIVLAAYPSLVFVPAASTATATGRAIVKTGQFEQLDTACYQLIPSEN